MVISDSVSYLWIEWCVQNVRRTSGKYSLSSYGMPTLLAVWLLRHGQVIKPSRPGQKWPSFWQTTNSKTFPLIKTTEFRFEFQRNLFPGAPVDNEQALVQVMTLRRTGNKPLPEVKRTKFTDAFMRHYGIWVKSIITCGVNYLPNPELHRWSRWS